MWPSPGAILCPATPFIFSASLTRRAIREQYTGITASRLCCWFLAMTPSSHRRAVIVACAGRRDRDATVGIFVELVAQRADRDAEDVGGMGSIAEAMLQRLQDQVALDVGHRAAHQRARHLLGGERRMRHGRRGFRKIEAI